MHQRRGAIQSWAINGRIGFEFLQLSLQDLTASMVLIAQINVDGVNAHHMRCDQHAF
jgi:hypothetical protein